MSRYSLTHLSDPVLDRGLPAAVAQERTGTADVLAYLAEFDARKRYLPAGYPSMFLLCGAPHRANYAEIGTMRRWRSEVQPKGIGLDGLREPPTSVHSA